MLAAVMENSGFSAANGSVYGKPPAGLTGLYGSTGLTIALAGANPGVLPAAPPALMAPMSVSVVPSSAASAALGAEFARPVVSAAAANAINVVFQDCMSCL